MEELLSLFFPMTSLHRVALFYSIFINHLSFNDIADGEIV